MMVGLTRGRWRQVRLDGDEITELPMQSTARRGISYLPQEASVLPEAIGRDNLLAILETTEPDGSCKAPRPGAAGGVW